MDSRLNQVQSSNFKVQRLLFLIILIAAVLRIPGLDKYPPALYSDEVSQGYNAYSIIKTGHDEYGKFWPVSLRSFGDWKPPLQTYLMLPTIAVFGLNAWGVRLPSAILGVLTVGLIYFLTKDLLIYNILPKSKLSVNSVALISSAWLAISPWHILQSRSAMLVGVTLFFLALGIWAFIKSVKIPRYLYLSCLGFALSIYGYYGMRVIVPLILVFLIWSFRQHLLGNITTSLYAALFLLLLLLPLGLAYFTNPDVVFGRAKTVSIFYDQGVNLTVKDLIAADGIHIAPKLVQFFHNKPYLYTMEIIRRFFQHLDGRFLFLTGDTSPPFQIPDMGILYLIDGIFLVIGTILLIKNSTSLMKFAVILITVSILPAALTFMTPASNRTLTLLIPFSFLISVGIAALVNYKKWTIIPISLIYIISLGIFINNFFIKLPYRYASWWHFGYKELFTYLKTEEQNFPAIYVSGRLSVPYIFNLFYNRIDPATVAYITKRDYHPDEFGFEYVNELGKYQFLRYFDWNTDKESLLSGTLLAVTGKEEISGNVTEIKQILYPDNQVAFRIYRIK